MQPRNLILSFVLFISFLVGWTYLQNVLWPRRPAPPSLEKQQPGIAATNLIVNNLAHGYVDFAFLDGAAFWAKRMPLESAAPVAPKEVVKVKEEPTSKDAPKTAPEPLVDNITLGGPDSYLQATLTTRGAGLRRLILSKFKGADYLGQPTGEQLELIRDDAIQPSYCMYIYPTAQAERPLPELGAVNWKLEGKTVAADKTEEVTFSTHVPDETLKHLKITKTYRLSPQDYHIGLTVEIKDDRPAGEGNNQAIPIRYQLTGSHGMPIEGQWYTGVFHNALTGIVDSSNQLWRDIEMSSTISVKNGGERVPGGDRGDSFIQYAGVATQYFASMIVVDDAQAPRDQGGVEMKNVLSWARPTQESAEIAGKIMKIDGDHVAFLEKAGTLVVDYVLLPRTKNHFADEGFKEGDLAVLSYYEGPDQQRVATWVRRGNTPRANFDDITVRVNSEVAQLHPGERVAHKFMLYQGPVKTRLLGDFTGDEAVAPALVDRYTYALHLNTLTDYSSSGPFGWVAKHIMWTDLIVAITGIMHHFLYFLHWVIGNYGISIIVLTLIVRGLMFPISRRQAYFSTKIQEISPEIAKIKEKYKHDKQAQSAATMELYRKHGVNPMGSCLPLVMQMPIFLGLYFALQESIHFRLAPFLWIRNLAAPDMLIKWGQSIPWISDPDNVGSLFYLGPYFNLLPLIAVVFMMIQQTMLAPPPTDEQQEMQQKMMKYMMIFFGIMFYKVAAGLCIYFIVSSVWGLCERKLLPKKKAPVILATAGAAGSAGGYNGKRPKGTPKKEDHPSVRKVKDWWADVLKRAEKR